ncbi:MAG: ORF6N domain-containing protein [Chitinophagaceae bacterium]|nr:ORF6N domain-containing protein [Chitinophagaceae bacterium]
MKKTVEQWLAPDAKGLDKVHLIRGQKVMLDSDLALLYQTPVKVLKQAVRRNKRRFPPDFMFELTRGEQRLLSPQSVTSKPKDGSGRAQQAPMAFTEKGICMLSGLLKTDAAIAVNMQLIRIFNRLRNAAIVNDALYREVEKMEKKMKKPDKKFQQLFNLLKDMLQPVDASQPLAFRIGKRNKAGKTT